MAWSCRGQPHAAQVLLDPGMKVAMSPSIVERYKSTLLILGIVIFIAGCLYMQVCKSCVDSYHNPGGQMPVL